MSAVPIPAGVELLLIRHGSTSWSEAGRLCGWSDVPLSARGRAEARALSRRLAEPSIPRGVWSSDLVRARQTARLAGLRAWPDRRLRELDFGGIDGARWEDLPGPTREALMAFERFRAPSGESVADLAGRVGEFVAGLSPGLHVLVTHGGVIRLLLRGRVPDRHVAPGGALLLEDQPAALRRPLRAPRSRAGRPGP